MIRANRLATVLLPIIVLVFIILTPFKSSSADRAGVEAFVTRFYQVCLDRNPEPEGLKGWTDALLAGTITGYEVAYGFIYSDEFQTKNVSNEEYLNILYEAFFNRSPDLEGFQGWLRLLESEGVEARTTVLDGFLISQEFATLCSIYGILPNKDTPNYNNSSQYEVWATDTDPTDCWPDCAESPRAYSFRFLGSSSVTGTFYGNYKFYIIVKRSGLVYIDSIKGSNGKYYSFYWFGNTLDWGNVAGPPDNKVATMGGYIKEMNAYIGIDASEDSLTYITVYVL